MHIRDNLNQLPSPGAARAVCVGGFDGFHLGHQYLLTQLCGLAWSRGLLSTIVTFEPLPAEYFAGPQGPPRRLTTRSERIELAAALCCDLMMILPFDEQLAQLSAAEFCQQVLAEKLNTRLLMASATHTIGRDKAGLKQLQQLGSQLGFEVVIAPTLQLGETRVSSTEIRRLLAEGHAEESAGLLGRRYRLSGTVITGRGVGTGLGFPTANLQIPAGKLLPADGVYAGLATLLDTGRAPATPWPAAISIGTAPTFNLSERLVEAHLLTNESLEIVGQTLQLEFVRRLRFQQKFSDVASLSRQIEADVKEVRQLTQCLLATADETDCPQTAEVTGQA
jgi:riboflavin kinase/FMN adenylyltransferase